MKTDTPPASGGVSVFTTAYDAPKIQVFQVFRSIDPKMSSVQKGNCFSDSFDPNEFE